MGPQLEVSVSETRYTAASENNPDANDGSAITDPGKNYEPPDTPVAGGTPGASDVDPVGMVRCRSCGMHTPANVTRCVRCNSPVRQS
jgi:hypothetical protein